MMFWIAIAMTISANLVYHLCAKLTGAAHPLASLAVTYGVSFLACVILYPLITRNLNIFTETKNINASSAILGLAIVLLECGFILAYRAGWNLGSAALFSNVAVSILLLPIAILYFGDVLSLKNGIGIVLAIIGLFLMAK